MAAAGPQIFVRVFSLKGISADVIKRFPKGRVSISSELGNEKVQTSLANYGSGSQKVNEVNE